MFSHDKHVFSARLTWGDFQAVVWPAQIVTFVVRHQSCPMHILTVYCPAFTYSMKTAILAAVPDHISGIDGIYQDGPDSRICPEAAVDV